MASISRNSHPAWYPPSASAQPTLMVYNSLTDAKEVFHPATGRKVNMYVCGPTVYDTAHVGHARTSLTFDILRRILSDYFHYEVCMQLNVTDIDDKIILKARKNELFRLYAESATNAEIVRADGLRVLAQKRDKIMLEISTLQSVKEFKDGREKAENETLQRQAELKREQLEQLEISMSADPALPALLDLLKDPLSDWLDAERGSAFTGKNEVFEAHARKFEKLYFDDCAALGIRSPDVITRVTEFIPEIVTYIEKISANGFAYESEGSVYFDTQKFKNSHDYPKLVPQAGNASAAEILEGEGALSATFTDQKKHRNDFALWKKSKAGEPSWPSPWGAGRPGWHIECSVMASSVFGAGMDIHGGGSDLKFPHHDNELAQSEAFYGNQQWVNYFLHAGHLHIKGLKMSKSLKNFITIRECLSNYSARQIRIMFLLQQWDKPVNFSDQSIAEAKEKEIRFNSFFSRVEDAVKGANVDAELKWDDKDRALNERISAAQENVHAALCDNFSTPAAMDALDDIVSAVNTYLGVVNPKPQLLSRAAVYVHTILKIFGVVAESFPSLAASQGDGAKQLTDVLDAFCGLRDQLRALGAQTKLKELFQICDDLRDKVFIDLGVKIEDDAKKSRWSLEEPETLRKELEAKIREKAEKQAKKASK